MNIQVFFSFTNGLISFILSGGWEGQAQFKMSFLHGGAIELGQHLFKLASNGKFMQNLTWLSEAVPSLKIQECFLRWGELYVYIFGSSIAIAVITVMSSQPLALLRHRTGPLPTAIPHLAWWMAMAQLRLLHLAMPTNHLRRPMGSTQVLLLPLATWDTLIQRPLQVKNWPNLKISLAFKNTVFLKVLSS